MYMRITNSSSGSCSEIHFAHDPENLPSDERCPVLIQSEITWEQANRIFDNAMHVSGIWLCWCDLLRDKKHD